MTPLTLPSSSNPGRYGADGAVRLINCFAEPRGSEGKIALPLYASDGLRTLATLTGGGRTRGMLVVDNFLYVVSERQLFKVDANFGFESLGGIPGDGPVYMARNQKTPTVQIAIVSDGLRFIVENDVITPISDPDLLAPNSVVFLNQYFVHTIATGRFQWSSLSEGTEYAALDFTTAEYSADGANRALVRRGELLIFGSNTIEPWYTPETGSNVFARSGTVIERGCLNGATVAMVEETPFFVADDETVRFLEGYQTRRISTHAVEKSIRETASQGNMIAWGYQKGGHSFYCLVGDDFTWVYDVTTGLWHERQSYQLSRWRAQFHAHFAGKHVVGDYINGKLYEIDEDTHDEGGAHMPVEVRFPLHGFPGRVEVNALHIDTIPGQGLNSTDPHVKDPKIMISASKNGGKTFGNERQASMGKLGEFSKRAKVNRLGTSKEDGFVFKLVMSAAVVRALTGLAADVKLLEA